jgi:hypothetical protein
MNLKECLTMIIKILINSSKISKKKEKIPPNSTSSINTSKTNTIILHITIKKLLIITTISSK